MEEEDGPLKRVLIIPALFLCFLFCACAPAAEKEEQLPLEIAAQGQVSVLFLKVGKADAALVCAAGKYYMIDTGTKDATSAMLAVLETIGTDEISGVFITHSHSDHIGGLKKLSKNYTIETVYRAEIGACNKSGINKIQNAAEQLALNCKTLEAGDRINITDEIYFEVLGPLIYNDEDDNDNSLILMLNANGHRVLFTGDMQFPEEQTLLEAGISLSADVLKVGNHGNPDATSEAFAQAVMPQFAVISTDTEVDTDSANARVKEVLSMALIYITEDTVQGVLLVIDADGSMQCSELM